MWFHDLAIDNHGGRRGLRNQNLLEQAISRPQRIWFYRQIREVARVAACYTASIIFIHPFFDGNKRTGWGTARLFARANGLDLRCAPEDSCQMVLEHAGSAKGEDQEDILAEFMFRNLYPL